MQFQEIERNSTPQKIVEEIIKKIESEELKPGDKLPTERELSVILNVGRSSVREAAKALVVMGYLDVIQGKGTYVSQELPTNHSHTVQLDEILEAASLFDLMEARKILECNVVELAVERADREQIRKLQLTVREMERSKDNLESFYMADKEFHFLLAEAAKNPIISEMMKIVGNTTYPHFRKLLASTAGTVDSTISTAREIVAMLVIGDSKEAARQMKIHLDVVNEVLKRTKVEKELT